VAGAYAFELGIRQPGGRDRRSGHRDDAVLLTQDNQRRGRRIRCSQSTTLTHCAASRNVPKRRGDEQAQRAGMPAE
jgi:hypothetical protein